MEVALILVALIYNEVDKPEIAQSIVGCPLREHG